MDGNRKKLKTIVYSILEIGCAFILSLLGCCWDWVNLEFSLERITTAAYWNNVAISTAMYSCASLLGMFFKLQRSELNNPSYDRELTLYREKLKIKDNGFVSFINNILNPKKKKERLIQKGERKLYKLDKYAREKWKIEFNDAIDSGDAKNYTFSSKWSKKYFERRMELEKLKSEEYIEKNWKSLRVHYPKVDAYTFTYYLDTTANDDDLYKTRNLIAKDIPIVILKKVLMSFLFATVIGMFLLDPSANELLGQAKSWGAIIIHYIVRVGMIIFNLVVGVFTAITLFRKNYIEPIANRTRILGEYEQWCNENPSVIKQHQEQFEAELKKKYEEKERKLIEYTEKKLTENI